jgi:hypothetical protein
MTEPGFLGHIWSVEGQICPENDRVEVRPA